MHAVYSILESRPERRALALIRTSSRNTYHLVFPRFSHVLRSSFSRVPFNRDATHLFIDLRRHRLVRAKNGTPFDERDALSSRSRFTRSMM